MNVPRMIMAEWRHWQRRGDGLPVGLMMVVGAMLYGWLLAVLLETSTVGGSLMDLTGLSRSGFHLAFRIERDMLLVLGFLMLQWGTATVAGEREAGTLRLLALRAPRAVLPLGKAAFLGLVATLLAFAVLLVSLAVGARTFGLTSVVAGPVEVVSLTELLGVGFWATILTLLPMASLLALSVAVSTLSRSTAVAQVVTVGLILGLAGLALVPGVGKISFLATAAWPLTTAANLGAGLHPHDAGDLLVPHLLVNLAWIVSSLTVAVLVCRRKDLA